jgi:choice-of-anchor C domain-containing protein
MTPSSTRLSHLVIAFLNFFPIPGRMEAADDPLLQSTNAPLAVYDLNQSFSTFSNPNGPWRYGWKQKLEGELTLLTFPKRREPVSPTSERSFVWQLNENESPGVGISHPADATTPTVSPSPPARRPTVFLEPGQNGAPENFAVARFTAPQGGTGTYRIECSIRYRDDRREGDTEFHILRAGNEIFDHHLEGDGEIGFTNVLALTEGTPVDFVVRRARDQDRKGSAVNIAARLLGLELEPKVRPLVEDGPYERSLPLAGRAAFSVSAHGTPPLTYQWFANDKEMHGSTNAMLVITNLKHSDTGRYAVRVSNRFGSRFSSNAWLKVYGPNENFIANGSFETGVDPGLSSQVDSSGTTMIDAWIIESGTIDYVGPRWTAFDGQRCVDLSGTTAGSIRQPIHGLTVGQSYRVRFYLAVNPESPPTSTEVQLSIAGVTNRYYATHVGTKSNLQWAEKTFEFTAAETNAVVRFKSLNRGWSGPIIDAVSCLPVDRERR